MKPIQVRFGVGDPFGDHSSVWRIWSNNKRSDIYLTASAVGSALHTSIHSSGVRHTTFTTDYALSKNIEASERTFIRWKEGQPTSSDLIKVEYRLRFPTDHLTKFPVEMKKPATWIPAAPAGQATDVIMLLGVSTPGDDTWPGQKSPGTKLLYKGGLVEGRALWIVYHSSPTEYPPNISEVRAAVRTRFSTSPEPTVRMQAWADLDVGGKAAMELSAAVLWLQA